MPGAPENISGMTPTDRRAPMRLADFDTFVEAMNYASGCETGFNFFNAKGEIVERLTYGEMRIASEAVAARLNALDLAPGARVGILAETDGDFVTSFIGALYAGLTPAPMPLPVAFGQRETYNRQLLGITEVADARVVLSPAEYADWVAEALDGREMTYVGALDGLPEAATAPEWRKPSPDDLAYLQFSSGTTGAPKGVAVTHRAMMANLRAISHDGLGFQPDDRGISWLPLYHDMGLVGCFLVPIATQMSADLLKTREFIRRPLIWLQLIQAHRSTITYAPSFGYDLALRRARGKAPEGMDLSSWRVAGIGGDMIKAPILRAFADVFSGAGFDPNAFVPSYGMAETTLALSFAPQGQGLKTERLDLRALEVEMVARAPDGDGAARDFALCGPALAGHQIEVRSEDGALLEEGRVGRVFAAGPSLMRDYFGNPEATAEALSDGWLDTGDLGFLRDGQIVITGRAKDLMIVNGRNIWPQDLEWTVERGVNQVRDGGVAAFSVTPDDSGARIEEEIVLVVECRARDAEAREEIREAVRTAVREAHGVEPLVALAGNGALPQTSSGKLARAKARRMYLDAAFDMGGAG